MQEMVCHFRSVFSYQHRHYYVSIVALTLQTSLDSLCHPPQYTYCIHISLPCIEQCQKPVGYSRIGETRGMQYYDRLIVWAHARLSGRHFGSPAVPHCQRVSLPRRRLRSRACFRLKRSTFHPACFDSGYSC